LIIAAAGHDTLAKLIYAWNLPVVGGPIASRHTGAELMYYGGTVVEVTLAAVVMAQWYQISGRPLTRTRRRSQSAGPQLNKPAEPARPPPARRTRSAAVVLQTAGQQPVPEGEIRAPLHAETTGDDDGE